MGCARKVSRREESREYEGDLNVDERLVADLVEACKAVAAALDKLPPPT